MTTEKILSVHHWNDKTFSITTTRSNGFRFRNGEFAMIGLEVDSKPLLRAYSVASANHEETLEFLSIKVPDGPLTSRLQHCSIGDDLLINSKTTGTLVLDFLLQGRNLFLLATGTGLAPYMSIVKDPVTYKHYEKVILVHTVRTESELAYRDFLSTMTEDEVYGDFTQGQFYYVPTVTRGNITGQVLEGRCTDLLEQDVITNTLDLPPVDPTCDRVMACGSMSMNKQVIDWCETNGFECGTNAKPGTYVYEKAFVD